MLNHRNSYFSLSAFSLAEILKMSLEELCSLTLSLFIVSGSLLIVFVVKNYERAKSWIMDNDIFIFAMFFKIALKDSCSPNFSSLTFILLFTVNIAVFRNNHIRITSCVFGVFIAEMFLKMVDNENMDQLSWIFSLFVKSMLVCYTKLSHRKFSRCLKVNNLNLWQIELKSLECLGFAIVWLFINTPVCILYSRSALCHLALVVESRDLAFISPF